MHLLYFYFWCFMKFDYLWKDGPEFAQSDHFRYGTDSVLLGNFVNLTHAKRAVDLGCASGVISLLMLSRNTELHVTGVEINREAAALAEENIRHNDLQGRCHILCGDLRNYRQLLKPGAYDVVVSNPPYFPVERGDISPDRDRAAARGELMCTLDDICTAAGWLCRWDGRFALVHRTDRLPEVFAFMQKAGIEPKRLRLVSHYATSVPSLVLVEGRRGGKPGLTMEPLLVLKKPDGSDSDEIERIYHRGRYESL